MVDKLREAYRLISLWAYEDIRNLSLCTIIRCNKIKRPSLAHSQWPIKRQKYFLLFLPCWLFLAEIEREVHPGRRTMEHEPAIYQYPIANNQWKVRSTSNFSFLVGYLYWAESKYSMLNSKIKRIKGKRAETQIEDPAKGKAFAAGGAVKINIQ